MYERHSAGDSPAKAGDGRPAKAPGAAKSSPSKAAAAPKVSAKSSAKRKLKAGDRAVATIQLQLVRSPIGRPPAHRKTVAALGLRRVGQTIEKKADPAVMGMVRQVRYMLRVDGQTFADASKIAAGA